MPRDDETRGMPRPTRLRRLAVAGGVGFVLVALGGWVLSACDSADETTTTPAPPPPAPDSGQPDTGSPIDSGDPRFDSGWEPDPSPCKGHEGQVICFNSEQVTCDAEGEIASETPCGDQACVPGTGCVPCIEGQYSCWGNDVRQCNTSTQPPTWDTIATCSPTAPTRCNPKSGQCEPLAVIGNGPDDPTGYYYQYSYFVEGSSPFKGGCDIDSFENYLYVNQGNWYDDGHTLDIYAIEVIDSDNDGEVEPNQHPDNPDAEGPVEERVLTHVGSYAVPHLGMVHHAEVYALEDRIFLLDAPANPGVIYEYDIGTGITTAAVTGTPALELAQLGFDAVSGIWYGSNEGARRVYSHHAGSGHWVAEFAYPNLAGSHMDGLEVVTDPNTGVSYVYVSDMTSDFIGQYRRAHGGTWIQVNLFAYYQSTNDAVEGMGFGALKHFWITDGSTLYEVGGGDLQKYTEPEIPTR